MDRPSWIRDNEASWRQSMDVRADLADSFDADAVAAAVGGEQPAAGDEAELGGGVLARLADADSRASRTVRAPSLAQRIRRFRQKRAPADDDVTHTGRLECRKCRSVVLTYTADSGLRMCAHCKTPVHWSCCGVPVGTTELCGRAVLAAPAPLPAPDVSPIGQFFKRVRSRLAARRDQLEAQQDDAGGRLSSCDWPAFLSSDLSQHDRLQFYERHLRSAAAEARAEQEAALDELQALGDAQATAQGTLEAAGLFKAARAYRRRARLTLARARARHSEADVSARMLALRADEAAMLLQIGRTKGQQAFFDPSVDADADQAWAVDEGFFAMADDVVAGVHDVRVQRRCLHFLDRLLEAEGGGDSVVALLTPARREPEASSSSTDGGGTPPRRTPGSSTRSKAIVRALRAAAMALDELAEQRERGELGDPATRRQLDFDSLVLDARSRHGRLLHKWLTMAGAEDGSALELLGVDMLLNRPSATAVDAAAAMHPRVVTSFVGYLAGCIAADVAVPPALRPVLERCVSTAVFERAHAVTFGGRHVREPAAALDARWRGRMRWAGQMTAEELGVPPEFIAEGMFAGTSAALGALAWQLEPTGMMEVLLFAIAQLHRDAAALDPTAAVNADTLFPILVYSLTRAEVGCIHACLRFLELYCASASSGDEAAYYLTCLMAVVSFLTSKLEAPGRLAGLASAVSLELEEGAEAGGGAGAAGHESVNAEDMKKLGTWLKQQQVLEDTIEAFL